ncbi:hypothetical protein [Chlamydia psittaci]|uniref:Uncharacterized protein n=1 Tax=Chlamydia psittaci 99DC5 TaxID=1112251 RepID=A0ABP2X342_CHLPS|nr:hypothetical protein [Chlamydia psittaci]EPJ27558.1 hypothetical protein CP99DC5_0982 [Chlamydia psittaci 99DC5]
MSTPKTNISLPTFVRFNIYSKDLSEEKKKRAITVSKAITAKNTNLQNLNCTNGNLNCKQDLFVSGDMSINTGSKNQTNFFGRVNLSDHTISCRKHLFSTNQQKLPQQYVPYHVFQNNKTAVSMRSALSGGHVGRGDVKRGAWIPWDKFETRVEQYENPNVYIGKGSDSCYLNFYATPQNPRLFRISVIMSKHGGWLDNGTGGECMLVAVVDGKETYLQGSTCSGTSYYRPKPMEWIATTFLARNNGYFLLKNLSFAWRVASFSWNVVQLPYFE